MKRILAVLAVAAVFLVAPAYAIYSVSERGEWPKDWPQELEPLRAHARTLIGPDAGSRHYAIRFANRDEFEAAWPHLLTVRSKGAPIFLVRGENFFLGDDAKAGVIVRCPPVGQWENPATPEGPIEGVQDPHAKWWNTNRIELVVDGEVVDLNRIPFPADTPIVDERFPSEDSSAAKQGG